MYSVANLQNRILPLWIEDYKFYDLARARETLKDAEYIILRKDVADTMNAILIPIRKYSVFGIYKWK
jgi:hypothetical protein